MLMRLLMLMILVLGVGLLMGQDGGLLATAAADGTKEVVYDWHRTDEPVFVAGGVSEDFEDASYGSEMQLLTRLHTDVRTPGSLYPNRGKINIAINVIFSKDGTVSVADTFVVDPRAPNYILSNPLDTFQRICGPTIVCPPAGVARRSRKVIVRPTSELFLPIVKSFSEAVSKLDNFTPAKINGVPVSVRRTFIYGIEWE